MSADNLPRIWRPAVLTGRRGDRVDAIDLFCGYGGSSQGIHATGAEVRLAANHSPLAIDCHAANYPDTDHVRADLSNPDAADYVDPVDLPPVRFLWASPSCKHHSPANAKRIYEEGPQGRLFSDGEVFDQEAYANSERSRVTMLCPLRYAARHRPEIVVVENVVEVTHWGPGKDGSTFRWWLAEWGKLGYEHECLFLNSAFFPPCPQSRDRVYVVFWRRGNRRPDLEHRPRALCTSDRCGGRLVDARQTFKPRTAAWPLPRWGKYGPQYVYTCPECTARVEPVAWPAYTAIDWTRLGVPIGERERHGLRPLKPATTDRVRRAMERFRGGPPIVIPVKAQRGIERPVDLPLTTVTTHGEKALVVRAGAVVPNRTNGRPWPVDGPMPSAVAGVNNLDLAAMVSLRSSAPLQRPVTDPLPTTLGTGNSVYLATDGVVVPAAGNTHERPGQVRARRLSDPLFTQHTTLAFGFAHEPALLEMRGGGSGERGVLDPAHTITAGGYHHGLTSTPAATVDGAVWLPWIDEYRSAPHLVTDQLATVMSHARAALAAAELTGDPVTDDDIAAVRFRMLDPDPELRRAMAFGDAYILIGNKTQMTAGLGNAVTPPVAAWITERCMATLAGAPEGGDGR